MRHVVLCFLAVAFLPVGCASPGNAPPAASASLPDARDLSEHPLDVLAIPQP